MKKPKILCWDIETADLRADWGHILCISYKWVGDEWIYTNSLTENPNYPKPGKTMWDDRKVIKDFLPVIASADFQVTWYGKKFDEPFVRSRMAHWGMKNTFPPIHHVDLWETSRKQFQISSNRLVTVGEFLQLDEKKQHMFVQDWKQAALGDAKKMRETEKRCASDVEMLEYAYEKIKPYIRVNRPNLNVIGSTEYKCPTCGSDKVAKAGTRPNLSTMFQRWWCKSCGSWSSSPMGRRHGVLR